MTVQNMWPLFFLILIPVIILLYLLKQKVKDETFSSIMLWQEIYKNLEAKTPFEKLKQNILMYLQILLMLLLIFALMAPMLKNGGVAEENTVLVMDNSASMQYLYDENDTRLDHSIKEAKKVIDSLSEGTTVTLISCGSEASVVYQGKDKTTLKRRLENIEPTIETGTLEQAAGVVNSVISGMEAGQIICYTDSAFISKDWTKNNKKMTLHVEDVYSMGQNCTLDYVNYSANEDGVEILAKVTNYGEDEVTQDISLYANEEMIDVQTVAIKPKESEIVYFEKKNIVTDGSIVLTAELSEPDALEADNKQSIAVTSNIEKKVLLLSEGNVFLEKALSLNENVEVFKSDNSNVLKQTEDVYDLYVFDGIKLSEDIDLSDFPDTAVFLFLNYEDDVNGLGFMTKESSVSNAVLSFKESMVTEYVEDYAFGITKAYTYALPEWAVPFLKTEDGKAVGYYGSVSGHNVGVLGFDIHNTDLALQTEFPIFMSQLGDMLLDVNEEKSELTNFPVTEESNVSPVDSVTIEGTKGKKKTGGRAIRNLILMIAILFLVIEWIVYVKQVNSTKKKQYFVVRCLVLVAIVLTMAGLSVSKKQKRSETIFLVDVSDSMSGNVTELEAYIKHVIAEMPEKNVCGVVAFGKDTAVDRFLSDKKTFSKFTSQPVTIATNIEKAVQSACSMFDDGVSKRLVLITDGSENEGSMSLAATTLKSNDVEFMAIPMSDSIGGNDEVYIDDLTAPNVIHVGDHYNITVSVMSNVETDALLSLYAGRNLKEQQDIHLNKGRNQFVFEDTGIEGNIAQYKAVVEPDKDTISVNNTYVTFSDIEAQPRVLLVEGVATDAGEFEKVLTAANIGYDKVTPKGVPITLSELNQYKAVITFDVHYDDLRSGFPTVLESYIKDFAGGYICIGGENSFALGNYKGTVLEDVLPVNMELQGEKQIPKMAMTMVIDQSGSMCTASSEDSSITGLDLAKQAALSGVSEVRPTDEVGVLAFDDKYSWIVPITQADDMDEINSAIETIGYGGGTSIYPALQQAYEKILTSDAKIKHIILLTDGQDEFRQYDELIQLINQADITVSTVAVGQGADVNTLSMIAEKCGGRFYYTDVNNSIPRIFAQEVYLSTNTYLINEEFYPVITSNHEIIEGVMDEGCPPLLGYIAATKKQAADVILESDREDPILTTWQYGLGRTVAWNSDGTNEWTAAYAEWDNYPMFWSNIINYVISDSELGEDSLEVVKEGNTAIVTYETKEYDKNTKVNAVVTDEDGTAKELPMDAVKPGVFKAELDMEDIGVYSVSLRKMDGEEIVKNYNTAYANQYSAEYQFSNSETDFLSFVKQAGGKEITLEDDIWTNQLKMVKAKVSLTIPLLIVAIFLFLFDIIIRRFSIDVAGCLKRVWNATGGRFGGWLLKKFRSKSKKASGKSKRSTKRSFSDGEASDTDNLKKDTSNKEESALESGIKGKKTERKADKKKAAKQTEPQSEKLDMQELLKKKHERE